MCSEIFMFYLLYLFISKIELPHYYASLKLVYNAFIGINIYCYLPVSMKNGIVLLPCIFEPTVHRNIYYFFMKSNSLYVLYM